MFTLCSCQEGEYLNLKSYSFFSSYTYELGEKAIFLIIFCYTMRVSESNGEQYLCIKCIKRERLLKGNFTEVKYKRNSDYLLER
jgi:predicted glycosyltransferase involved in capsule biosynthesis